MTIGWFHIVFRKRRTRRNVRGRFCIVSTQLPIRSKQVQWLSVVGCGCRPLQLSLRPYLPSTFNLACHIYHRRKKWNSNGGVHSHTGIQRSCWYPKWLPIVFIVELSPLYIYSSTGRKANNGLFYRILLFENRINLKLPCHIWEVPKVFRSICLIRWREVNGIFFFLNVRSVVWTGVLWGEREQVILESSAGVCGCEYVVVLPVVCTNK